MLPAWPARPARTWELDKHGVGVLAVDANHNRLPPGLAARRRLLQAGRGDGGCVGGWVGQARVPAAAADASALAQTKRSLVFWPIPRQLSPTLLAKALRLVRLLPDPARLALGNTWRGTRTVRPSSSAAAAEGVAGGSLRRRLAAGVAWVAMGASLQQGSNKTVGPWMPAVQKRQAFSAELPATQHVPIMCWRTAAGSRQASLGSVH